MFEKFVTQTDFASQQDFIDNFQIIVPDNFNFAYDVMDEWAAQDPEKLAMLWTNDQGKEVRFTYKDLKYYTDQTASYLQQQGIGKGDCVMLILKRHWQFWYAILGLHKIGAVAIPATNQLKEHDLEDRIKLALEARQ